MLQAFVPNVSSVFSGRMLQFCLSGCCICSIHMLHVFYSDVAYGCNGFQVCFRCVFQIFQKHVLSVSTTFRRMLQSFFLCLKNRSGVASLLLPPYAASSLPAPIGHPYDAAAESFRIGDSPRPSPLVARAAQALRGA